MYSVLCNNLHGKIIWERIYIYAYAELFNGLEHGAYCVLHGVSGMFALSTESLLGLLVLSATPAWLWGVYIVLHTILAGFFFFHFWWMGLLISGMKRKRWLSPSAVNTRFARCLCRGRAQNVNVLLNTPSTWQTKLQSFTPDYYKDS